MLPEQRNQSSQVIEAMWGHDKAVSHRNYDEFDECETDRDEQEEELAEPAEVDEQDDPKPTKDELEYLRLRERLKERIRQKYKKENAAAFGHSTHSRDKNGTTTNVKFGSFFGPSQPVIAARVIEESRSVRETQHITAKFPTSSSGNKPVSMTAETKTNARDKPGSVVNELKTKVQTLKDTRDYAFLLSDNAELPAPPKEPAPRNVSVSNPAQAPPKAMLSTNRPARPVSDGHESKDSLSRNQHAQTKVGYQKAAPLSRPKPSTANTRKLLGGNAGNGPDRPAVPKASSHAPAQNLVTKKTPAMITNKSLSSLERTSSSTKPHSSTQKQYCEQRRETQGVGKAKFMPKQPIASSKPQLSKPSKQFQQRSMREDHPKKKPVRKYSDEEEDDPDMAIKMIRNLFRYNPNKYAGVDEDDSDMEANFDDILREEKRSSKIGRQEDEEQLRLIEEEERRERLRREGKKRKLVQR